MESERLIQAITRIVPIELARGLVDEFLEIRRDLATKTLGRSAPGKFVETYVQILQHIARGSYETAPKVDDYLDKRAEGDTSLPDGLRICGARIARSIYTLRNKRNIAHKGEVDPNSFDLAYVHQAASWIIAEMIRNAAGITMQEAGALIEFVQVPVGDLVEEIDGVRLVHANVTVGAELLILLHSHYPDPVSLPAIKQSLVARNSGTVGNKLREMTNKKLVVGSTVNGYRLTQAGHKAASEEIRTIQKTAK